MLDRFDTPTLLVQHSVLDDAADRKLAVLLDRIILEVLVSAVAVHEEAPVRITLTDAPEKRQIHGRAFDVERLVILDDRHGVQWIECARGHVDDLAKHL